MTDAFSSSTESVEAELLKDPAFRQEWTESAPYRQVALELIRVRTLAGLTQQALADKIGTSRSTISRMESFEYGRISWPTLMRIATALGLEVEIRFKKAG